MRRITQTCSPQKSNTETVVGKITRRIVDNFDPLCVILFGSQARGDSDRHSDIDILVIMENGTDKFKTETEIRKVVKDLPKGKDVVVVTPDDVKRRGHVCGYVIFYALREGVVLYER